ncbi:MAG: DUF2357 domain-containing protein [Bacteroidota bacterium]
MPRLHFVLDQGGELILGIKSAHGPIQPVGTAEEGPHFACHQVSLKSHDLTVSPHQQPCFFVWQKVELLLQMPHAPKEKGGYQIWLTNQCLIKGKADQDRLFISTILTQAVGRGRLRILAGDGTELAAIELEVFPQKLDYRQDYGAMMRELERITYRLLTGELRRTFGWLDSSPSTQSHIADWEVLDPLTNRFSQAIERLLLQADQEWRQQEVPLNIERIRRLSFKQRPNSHPKPGVARGLQAQGSFASDQNRAIHQQILMLEKQTKEWLSFADSVPQLSKLPSLKRFHAQLKVWARNPMFEGFSSHSDAPIALLPQFLPPVYQQVIQTGQQLRQGLHMSQTGWLQLGYRDIHQVYETWAVLTVVQLIGEQAYWEVIPPSEKSGNGTHWLLSEDRKQLRKGASPLACWQHQSSGDQASLWYQRPFLSSEQAPFPQIPDLILEVQKMGHQTLFRFFFEIKYQLEAEANGTWGPPKSGIAQLHRYRDAILSQKETQEGTTTALKSWGGVVLFPFPGLEVEFVDHPLYQRLQSDQIGAIPLHPGSYRSHQLLQEQLAYWLDASPEQLEEQMIDYRKG